MPIRKRRATELTAGCVLLSVGVSGIGAAGAPESPHPRKPNVLFILSDDQRPDTIGALGNSRIRTPHLDRLVREGTAFTRAVCPNPLCVPSRVEILTGCSGFRNGVLPGYRNRLDPRLTLWPEAMRQAGYLTWHIGKWHVAGRPSARGYTESQGLFSSGAPNPPAQVDFLGRPVTGYRGWVFQTDDRKLFPERGVGLTGDISERFADAAISFIERKSDRPFFLHVNFTAPHDPLYPLPEYLQRYPAERMPLPANYRSEHPFDHGNREGRDEVLWPYPRKEAEVRADLAAYYAVISHMDAQVGRVLDSLDRTGQAKNTLVIFAGDHGLAIGSHGLRGKQNMYEHTVGVPLLMRGPGVPRGKRKQAQVYLRDLYPTTCELAGVPLPPGVEARSFAPVLRGRSDRHHAQTFGYFMDVQRMVRTDRWKLIHYPRLDRYQLFDLRKDPHERHDLSSQPARETVRNELKAALRAWQQEVRDPLAATLQGSS